MSDLDHSSLSPPAVVLALVLTLVLAAGAAHAQLPPPPAPPENPVSVDKANLGKVLFWDEQVSSTRTVACGSCHLPSLGGEDPKSGIDPLAVNPGLDMTFGTEDDVFGSPGVPLNSAAGLYDWSPLFGMIPQVTGRKTVPAINAGYADELFWDGRAPSEFVDPVTLVVEIASGGALESQAVAPPASDVEMGHVGRDWVDVVARVGGSVPLALSPDVPQALRDWIAGRSYAELFEVAFGSPGIDATRTAKAIATYERTLFTDETPFDQYVQTATGLTAQEVAGFSVFNGIGRCKNCHDANPPRFLFSDNSFRYTGVRPQDEDEGRKVVTGDPDDQGKMRVPSLRNIELRAPYMHNGRFAALTDVIEFYNRGGDFDGPNKDTNIQPLGMSQQQKDDLLAFLTRPLTDPRLAAGVFPFDRPALYAESERVPAIEGSGVPGTGGEVPEIVALEPPLIGNPSFTVGVWNALGGASARLVIDDHDPGVGPAPSSGAFWVEDVVLGGSGAGNGFGSSGVAIADASALAGRQWFGRWYVFDAGAAGGVAVSRLVHFRTFAAGTQADVFHDGFESGDTSAWTSTAQ